MRDILVHVDGSDAGAARARSAAALARRFGAALSGLHVTPPVDISPGVPLAQVDTLVAVSESRLAADARLARKVFAQAVAGSDLKVSYHEQAGEVAQSISEAARYADLVVLGQYEHEGNLIHHPLPVCHEVSVRCGRPVLVLPAAAEAMAPAARVLVAWDGGREAVRAVHDALPFLAQAAAVEVVVASPAAGRLADDVERPRRLADHLSHHGVKITGWSRIGREVSEADAVRRRLAAGRYDLLVMGAYSHPEWYEFLVGGVTRSLLFRSSAPILLSH